MPQMTIFINKLSDISESLRVALEGFLEGRHTDLISIQTHIKDAAALLQTHKFKKGVEACQLCEKLVNDIQAAHEGKNESTLLRLCLLFSRMIEDAHLDIQPNDQLFNYFVKDILEQLASDQNEQKNDIKLNHKLIKVLRTLYQRQLLRLIKENNAIPVLQALSGVCEEIQMELPSCFQPEWKAVNYYVDQLLALNIIITPRVHRLMGAIDQRFNLISHANQNIYQPVYPDLLAAISNFPEGKPWIEDNIPTIEINPIFNHISAATYARFVDVIKEPLLKLHEGFELLSLDSKNIERLTQSIQFLSDLNAILQLMDRPNLATLVSHIATFVANIKHNAEDQEALLHIITKLWVLEQFITTLWKTEDADVPISNEKIITWIFNNSVCAAYSVLAEQYSILRSYLESSSATTLDQKSLDTLIKTIKAESLIGLTTSLTQTIHLEIEKGLCDKSLCLELILALEYCARRKSENKEISQKLINQAKQSLENAQNSEKPLDQTHIDSPTHTLAETNASPEPSPKITVAEPLLEAHKIPEPIYNKEVHIIATKIDAICASWEAIGEDAICRAALHKTMNLLCDLCMSLGLEQGARLSYEWSYWLGKTDSKVVLTHTAQLKNATKQIIKHIEQDIEAQDLAPYFQFINTNYGAMTEPDKTNLSTTTDPQIQTQNVLTKPELDVDPDILNALLEEIEESIESVQEIFESTTITSNDIEILQRIAHTLRGSANIIGLTDTAKEAYELEKEFESLNDISDASRPLIMARFSQIFETIRSLSIQVDDHVDASPIDIIPLASESEEIKPTETKPIEVPQATATDHATKPKIRSLEEILKSVRK